MQRLAALLVLFLCALGHDARAQVEDEILEVYKQFAQAQNARDPERIGAFFIDAPQFLWVSDGKSFWGRDAVLARMGSFQKAEIWRVEPALDEAEVVPLADGAAMLHMPLTLVIGQAAAPNQLPFLVSIVFTRKDQEPWRIAALLTTGEKP
ncbi:MAG: nuclear transport factor 2 family protein [Geminicoccaceae bacterium]